MKRVLLTVHKFFPAHKAGTEVLALKTAQELIKRGYEVLVVTGNPPDLDARLTEANQNNLSSDYEFDGVKVHVVEEGLRLGSYSFSHEFYHPEIKNHFGRILDEFRPDLVHIVHAQNLSSSIIDAAKERNLPVVFSATDFWFVCPIVQLTRPDGAMCRGPEGFSQKGRAHNCLTCYTPKLFAPVSEFSEAMHKKSKPLAQSIDKLPAVLRDAMWQSLYKLYLLGKIKPAVEATLARPKTLIQKASLLDAIAVPTKLMYDIFVENGIKPELLEHIPYGLDTSRLVVHQNKTPSDKLRIGFIGTLYEHKGTDLLIRAFQALPVTAKAQLTIYGDTNQFPEYTSKLEELCKKGCANSDKITFAGTFANEKLGEVLENMDVLVVPSRWYENTPLVIQSALATKTPVIATDLGGMSELIQPGVNGLLFTLNDVDSLKQQLEKLLNNPQLLLAMRNNIKPERTIAQMVDDLEAIYAKVENAGKGALVIS